MKRAWRVIWFEGNQKKRSRNFEGDLPKASGAVAFAQKVIRLRKVPVEKVHIISVRHGFAPPISKREPPEQGMIWCPYCIKWRVFRMFAIQYEGYAGPVVLRCPVCTISMHDYHVRLHNPLMAIRSDLREDAAKPVKVRRQRR